MIAYWLMFLPAAAVALAERSRERSHRDRLGAAGVAVAIILTVLIGYRYQVGGDWGNYIGQFNGYRHLSISQIVENRMDLAYALLSQFSAQMDWGIIGVNVMCALFFSWGLVAFCRAQPRFWLALAVAIPYLVIVVAMGYTRQGVAIGLAMLALRALGERSNVKFALWIIAAALFHKSAIVILPIAILATTEKRLWTAVWVTITTGAAYSLLLADSAEKLYSAYVGAQMQSAGAVIRIAMNAVPALLFLALRHRFDLDHAQRRLWTWLSIFALGSVLLLAISPSTTAVDRMALYFIPLQLFVFSRLPDALRRLNIGTSTSIIGVIFYYGAVQFVWLNFAAHSYAWVPYRFYLFEYL